MLLKGSSISFVELCSSIEMGRLCLAEADCSYSRLTAV